MSNAVRDHFDSFGLDLEVCHDFGVPALFKQLIDALNCHSANVLVRDTCVGAINQFRHVMAAGCGEAEAAREAWAYIRDEAFGDEGLHNPREIFYGRKR